MKKHNGLDKGPAFPGMGTEAQVIESVIGNVYKVNAYQCIFRDDSAQIDWKLRSSSGASFIFSLFRFPEGNDLYLAIDFCFLRTPREPTIEFRNWLDRENHKIALPCRLVLFQESGQSLVTINACFRWGLVAENRLEELVDGMSGYSDMFIREAQKRFDVVTYYWPE